MSRTNNYTQNTLVQQTIADYLEQQFGGNTVGKQYE